VPLTPELALQSGLDVAAWDAERLFHSVSVGTYQAYMNHAIGRWKKVLKHGTPVLAYIGCSPQTGQYLGLEEYRAAAITLRFKIENVMRDEQFRATLNDQPIDASQQQVRYAANGRDTRIHTVTLGPYLEYEVSLRPSQLRKGENRLEVVPTKLLSELATKINLLEIELLVSYTG